MSNLEKIASRTQEIGANAPASITLESSTFTNGNPIPDRNSAYYDDVSPALSWSNVPANAKSLVLIVEDPDAPRDLPFLHWTIINLPVTATDLPENQPKTENLGAEFASAQQGANGYGTTGYLGPKPPAGHGTHHYFFQLFALDIEKIDLLADYSLTELLAEISGHVVAKGELVGTYERAAE